jgi:hypothetical protein
LARAAVTGFASRSRSSADTPSRSATNSTSLSMSRRTTAAASRAAIYAAPWLPARRDTAPGPFRKLTGVRLDEVATVVGHDAL